MAYQELSSATTVLIESAGLDVSLVVDRVSMALDEDLAYGPDATTDATVPSDQTVKAFVAARSPGVISGVPVAVAVLDLVIGAGRWQLVSHKPDGSALAAAEVALEIVAPTRGLLTAERTVLNFLCHLSGVATLTAAWSRAVAPAKVRDTRKTIPGLRVLEKYAVRCGGGMNHRMGLGDAGLVKDNHVVAAGSVAAAVGAIRASNPSLPLEVECDNLSQVREAIDAGVDLILLDNMSIDAMREAVQLAGQPSGSSGTSVGGRGSRGDVGGNSGVRFEASGGLTLATAAEVASTGVDFVAVGALTHSAPTLDLGLDGQQIATPSTTDR